MKDEKDLFEGGITEAKTSYVIFENVVTVILLVCGFMGMAPLSFFYLPLLSLLYGAFVLFMLIFFLRKHLCTQCYYYGKVCHCGWGKLSAKLFKKETGNQKLGGIAALFTWTIFMFLPPVVMIVIMVTKKASIYYELIFFVPFVILVLINMVLHKADCEKCKMRYICPGSAAKKR